MFDALKKLKDKAEEVAETHSGTISQGLTKVGGFIDDKTDRKYSDKIDTGVEKAQGFVERLGEKKSSD